MFRVWKGSGIAPYRQVAQSGQASLPTLWNVRFFFGFFQPVGVVAEEINAQGLRNEEELLRVDDGFLKNFVHCPDVHVDTLRQPTVVLALSPQLVADEQE